MTKFYDHNSILEITLRYEKTGEDISRDYFQDAVKKEAYNEELDAYKVDDVEYLVDYVKSELDGTNRDVDYPEDYDPANSGYDLSYSIEARPNINPDQLETAAAGLYDGGWRKEDRDDLQKEYDLTDHDADQIAETLGEYENK